MKPIEIVLAAATMAVLASAQQGDIIGITGGGDTYTIDSASGFGLLLTTGAVPVSAAGPAGLALDPSTGDCVALQGPTSCSPAGCSGGGGVYFVDTVTGTASPNGIIVGAAAGGHTSLACDSLGTYFGVFGQGQVQSSFGSFDPSTGATNIIANFVDVLTGLDFDPSGNLWGWSLNDGLVAVSTATGARTPVAPGSGTATIESLAFSPSGVLYGAGDDLYTIDLGTGVATLVGVMGSSGFANITGIEFPASAIPATYPGNGSDVATRIGVNGVPRPPRPGVTQINATDVITMTFVSPTGTLMGHPFVAFWQLFVTGSPPGLVSPPGIYFDPALISGVIADGLTNPGGVLNPVLGGFVAGGTLPGSLGGASLSLLISCLTIDTSFPPFNFGIADAQEIQIN